VDPSSLTVETKWKEGVCLAWLITKLSEGVHLLKLMSVKIDWVRDTYAAWRAAKLKRIRVSP